MPQIAELKEIDGSVWARVPMELGCPIQILSPVEIEANRSRENKYLDEIERLRKALEEIIQVGGQDLCRGIAAEALRLGQ